MTPNGSYTRCSFPRCCKRVVDGHLRCGLHGGPEYQVQHIPTPPTAVAPEKFAWRMTVEDTLSHISRCPICMALAFDTPPWLWSTEEMEFLRANGCQDGQAHGQRLLESWQPEFRPPYWVSQRTETENSLIKTLLLHTTRCKFCRGRRDESCLWEWQEPEKTFYMGNACNQGTQFLVRWDNYLIENPPATEPLARRPSVVADLGLRSGLVQPHPGE